MQICGAMNRSMKSIFCTLRVFAVLSVVLAFGWHSLIPEGYMPDFSGHGFLTYCDGTDHTSDMDAGMHMAPGMPMDHAMHMGHMHHGSHGHAHVCPFSTAAVYGLCRYRRAHRAAAGLCRLSGCCADGSTAC